MSVFVFDIETVPDVDAGRKIYQLDGLDDAAVAEAMMLRAREDSGSDFVRTHLHQIVAISVVFRTEDMLKVWSLGQNQDPEHELIERFFQGIEKFRPTLVSWNGGGFDLPVLHYRALKHGVQAPLYWETGETDSNFKWNNYLNRFHTRHLDLMDILSNFQMRAAARLDEVATMLGFPGKMGMDGSKVWANYHQGNIDAIRNYCETDVLNTYLVYLRYQLIRGYISKEDYQEECITLHEYLKGEQKPHFDEFLNHWS